MLTFRVEPVPKTVEPSFSDWLSRQFFAIQKAANAQVDYVYLRTLNAAPAKYSEGVTVLADGTNWDPGSGQGVYTYYAGAWHKLG